MAATLTLYPPIVDTYMPAFVITRASTDKCRIYFSLSKYNNSSDIVNAQIIIKNQYNNKNILSTTRYPSEVMLKNISVDNTVITDNKYYIEITGDDIEGGFDYDTYYKVQIRFTSKEASAVSMTIPQAISTWLNNNLEYFSEWSTVCLIYGISQPNVRVPYNITEGGVSTIGYWNPDIQTEWTQSSTVSFVGRMTYAYFDEQESLKRYRIKLYNSSNQLLLDSDYIYNDTYDNNNVIDYNFDLNLEQGEDYHFTFEYETNNLYKETITYSFVIVETFTDSLAATIQANKDQDNGRMKIQLLGTGANTYTGDIIIRRASSKDNYLTWENLKKLSVVSGTPINSTIYDNTFESGVFYKYSAQKMNASGYRGTAILSNPIMMILDYAYLTTANRQLKMSFNQTVSSLTKVVMDTTTSTIGAKYPFIKRNANVEYLQMPISGLISFNDDIDGLFYSRAELLGANNISAYDIYNEANSITNLNDVVYERAFREKVLDFLNDNAVKLYRSPTEGNILIKLTGISLSPVTGVGRLIYSFNATAIEIADNNIKNYEKYEIIDLNNLTRLDQIVASLENDSISDSLIRN